MCVCIHRRCGVKHQKDSRSQGTEKNAKYVENTVIHIQYGQDTYALTACGMKNAMKAMLAFLVFNGLLQNRLVFLQMVQGISKAALRKCSRSIHIL